VTDGIAGRFLRDCDFLTTHHLALTLKNEEGMMFKTNSAASDVAARRPSLID
jgi:hypothetical protein